MAKRKPAPAPTQPVTPHPSASTTTLSRPARQFPDTKSRQPAPKTVSTGPSLLWLPVVALAVFAAFSFGFGNAFVDWDDAEYVFENPLILNPTADSIRALLRTPIALNYHPLTMLSLAANSALFGPQAGSFIVTNTLIHVLNTVLVFWLAYALGRKNKWVGLFVALLWGLHPMHVESVIWVSERKDVLYTFFFLTACLTYLRYRSSRRTAWLALTFGLFLLSCLSKAMAVVLPLILLLIDYRQGRNPLSRPAILEKVPFFAISLFIGLLAADVQAGGDFHGWLTLLGQKKNAIGQEPFAARWLVYGSFGFMMYLVKFLFPYPLVAFYPYPENVAQPEPHHWLGPFFFLGVVAVIGWSFFTGKSERRRLAAFSLGFFLITLLLVLQFMTVGAAVMADRYSYLSYFGLCFLLVYGLYLATRNDESRRRWATVGLCLFAGACFWLTTRQVRVWSNTETLWTHALRYYPDNDQMREGLGDYFGKNNRLDEAITQFSAAVQNGTVRYHCYEGLGNAYGLKGDLRRAIDLYNRAAAMDSSKGDVFYNRGLTLNKMGRFREAVRDFNKAYLLIPAKDSVILAGRGFAFLQLKEYERSKSDYDRLLLRKPNDPTALHNRGVDRFYLGDRPGALSDIRRALALKPDYAEARNNLRQLEQAQ